MSETLIIPVEDLNQIFVQVLLRHNFSEERAERCAEVFTENSVDGLYTHGVNRFPRFINNTRSGYIHPQASASLKHSFAGIEQWDGNLGPGPLNAIQATDRAMKLAEQNGIGMVSLANTNHWMRGGYYGWQAAKKGFVFIGWTNTTGNMPAWNAIDSRLGNNPLVLGLPYENEAIVMDMAMSQFSYGSMEQAKEKDEQLSVYGGFDIEGALTTDPAKILESGRPLPIGFWKGAGLSFLLDVLASILSGGLATYQISQTAAEYSVSQVFICIDISKLHHQSSIQQIIKGIIEDYRLSIPDGNKKVYYPGEGTIERRKKNLQNGVPVLKTVWEEILKL